MVKSARHAVSAAKGTAAASMCDHPGGTRARCASGTATYSAWVPRGATGRERAEDGGAEGERACGVAARHDLAADVAAEHQREHRLVQRPAVPRPHATVEGGFTDAAATRTRTSRGPHEGTGTSLATRNASGPPNDRRTAARIVEGTPRIEEWRATAGELEEDLTLTMTGRVKNDLKGCWNINRRGARDVRTRGPIASLLTLRARPRTPPDTLSSTAPVLFTPHGRLEPSSLLAAHQRGSHGDHPREHAKRGAPPVGQIGGRGCGRESGAHGRGDEILRKGAHARGEGEDAVGYADDRGEDVPSTVLGTKGVSRRKRMKLRSDPRLRRTSARNAAVFSGQTRSARALPSREEVWKQTEPPRVMDRAMSAVAREAPKTAPARKLSHVAPGMASASMRTYALAMSAATVRALSRAWSVMTRRTRLTSSSVCGGVTAESTAARRVGSSGGGTVSAPPARSRGTTRGEARAPPGARRSRAGTRVRGKRKPSADRARDCLRHEGRVGGKNQRPIPR